MLDIETRALRLVHVICGFTCTTVSTLWFCPPPRDLVVDTDAVEGALGYTNVHLRETHPHKKKQSVKNQPRA